MGNRLNSGAVSVSRAKISQDQSNQLPASKQWAVPLAVWRFTDGESSLEQAAHKEQENHKSETYLELVQLEWREYVWLTFALLTHPL